MKKLLTNRRCWVFDLDGTLTLPVHDFGFIRRELAIPDGEDILGHLATLPPDEADRSHQRLDSIERELAAQSVASAGTEELLAYLHGRGARLGIVTRNSRAVAKVTLEAIGVLQYFGPNWILGRTETPPKPDPAGILHLQQQWQAQSDELVMVGDYLYDLQAGRSAGALTVHVSRPDGLRWPDQSDIMVETLAELVEMIETSSSSTHYGMSGV